MHVKVRDRVLGASIHRGDPYRYTCSRQHPTSYGPHPNSSPISSPSLAQPYFYPPDPDGYWVEIVRRGGYDAEATPYWIEPQPAES